MSGRRLHEHLKRIHGTNAMKRKADEELVQQTTSASARSTASAPGPMKKYLLETNENSLPAVLSRLTACDGLSFRVIATSKDLRRGLVAMELSTETAGDKARPSNSVIGNLRLAEKEDRRPSFQSDF